MSAHLLTPYPLGPAVFLDRDDTLNDNAGLPDEAFGPTRGDLYRPEHIRLLPGVLGACIRLAEAGYMLVVITNQACVARGSASIRDVEATNDRLRELLVDGDRSLIRAVYAAPHHPEAAVDFFRSAHPWRKPGPGMIEAAAAELGIDLSASWLVGDAERDLEAGRAAGIDPGRCLRVGPCAAFPGLSEAADHIISSSCAAMRPASVPCETVFKASIVRLRSQVPGPLSDVETRRMVESAAHAIAERTGVKLIDLELEAASVTAVLATHRLAALGFMAELRRSTNDWYAHKHPGRRLWTGKPDFG